MEEITALWGFTLHQAWQVTWGFFLAIVAFQILRHRKLLQEKVLPMLDELRASMLKALNKYIKLKKSETPTMQDAIVIAAAMIGGAFRTAMTLYAMVTPVANLATPVG